MKIKPELVVTFVTLTFIFPKTVAAFNEPELDNPQIEDPTSNTSPDNENTEVSQSTAENSSSQTVATKELKPVSPNKALALSLVPTVIGLGAFYSGFFIDDTPGGIAIISGVFFISIGPSIGFIYTQTGARRGGLSILGRFALFTTAGFALAAGTWETGTSNDAIAFASIFWGGATIWAIADAFTVRRQARKTNRIIEEMAFSIAPTILGDLRKPAGAGMFLQASF